jgi:hypothetical protein
MKITLFEINDECLVVTSIFNEKSTLTFQYRYTNVEKNAKFSIPVKFVGAQRERKI